MRPLRLHDLHAARGATFGEVGGCEVVRAFSPLADEYAAARSAAILVDLSYREWIRIVGEDRVSFLHGMVTNDVSGMAVGGTTYAALLTAKGAMVGDARIWRRASDLLLDVEPGLGEKLRGALDKYLISEDAELQDATEGFGLLGIYGPRAAQVLAAIAPAAGGVEQGRFATVEIAAAQAEVTATRSYGVPGFELMVAAEALSAVYARIVEVGKGLGVVEAGFDALEVLRVETGTPRYGADMDDKTIPLEANLEHALHYKKGCYIGQEVIARATFRGHMNRKLSGLTLEAEPTAPRSELFVGERRIGWITSVVRSPTRGLIALGYVHRDYLAPGTKVDVAEQGKQVAVTPLPFV